MTRKGNGRLVRMTPAGHKWCSQGEDCVHPDSREGLLPVSEFGNRSGTLDGLQYRCKACRALYDSKRRRPKARTAGTPRATYPADSIFHTHPIDPKTGRPANYWAWQDE